MRKQMTWFKDRQKTLMDTSPKKIYRLYTAIKLAFKKLFHIMSYGKFKQKQWDATAKGQNTDHWQHQMLVRMWSHTNSHSLLIEIQNSTATLEDSLAISSKSNHILIIQSSNHNPKYLPKWVENLCPQNNVYINVHGSFVHNFQNLEASKISFSR